MGRKWNKRKKRGETKDTKVDKPKRERSDAGGYVVAVKENKDFEIFYKSQNIVPEEEWSDFIASLQSSLPVAFRITGNTTQAVALQKIFKNDFFKPLEEMAASGTLIPISNTTSNASHKTGTSTTDVDGTNGSSTTDVDGTNGSSTTDVDGTNGSSTTDIDGSNGAITDDGINIDENINVDVDEPLKPLEPKCISWYPGGLAYQLNLSRRDIRRCEAYWRLHQCLITETNTGSISRQETVSMIPPLLLDVKPHHKVLDMCAAPGSKTAQIIELLHSSSDPVARSIPPGVVVANDADNKRCYLLAHQTKRLQSPSIIITNHDAAFMPNMLYTKPDGKTGKMKFDRILCDVPCSGDGTLRKNCDVWTKWNPVNGCNLHGLQLRIARRGVEMLCVGGRMVYSTCSMSPMENESVLQRLLNEAQGALRLVDMEGTLPGLRYCPGLTKWTVMTKDMKLIPTPADIPKEWTNVYHKHLFPADQDMHLDRCLRLMPHHQDTGAFFVAVLEKTAPLPGEAAEDPTTVGAPPPRTTPTVTAQRQKSKPGNRRQGFKEEPFYYLSDSIAEWENNFKSGNVTEPFSVTGRQTNGGQVESESKESHTSPVTEAEKTGTSTVDNPIVADTGNDVAAAATLVADASAEVSIDAVVATVDAAVVAAERKQSSTAAGDNAKDAVPVYDNDKEDLRIWSHISTFFGVNKNIPEASYKNFMTRSQEGKKRNLYFTNSFVRDLIDRNQDRMKIINTGVKVLVRTDNKGTTCDFRLAQEGIQSILPLITKRLMPVIRSDLVQILNDNDNDNPPELALMSPTCREAAAKLVTGSVLMEYCGDPFVADDEQVNVMEQDKMKIQLVGWKGKSTMRCYVARNDRIHYLRLLRADTSKYETNKFRAAAASLAAEKEVADDETSESANKKVKLAVDEAPENVTSMETD